MNVGTTFLVLLSQNNLSCVVQQRLRRRQLQSSMIPVKSNLGSLLRLWTRLYVDSRLNAAWRRGRKEEPSKEEWKRRSNRDSPSQFNRHSGHAQIQKADSESIGRRRRLILPTAQVGEFELEDIVKTRISRAGNNAKAVFSGSDASGRLLTAFLITLWSRRIEDCTNGQDPPINVNTFTLEQNFCSIELHRRSRPFCGDHVPIHTQAEGLCGFREQIISVSFSFLYCSLDANIHWRTTL